MRAWRLPWPPAFKLFEVDSATVLGFKARVLAAAGPVFEETLTVDRVEVVADAAKPHGKKTLQLWPPCCFITDARCWPWSMMLPGRQRRPCGTPLHVQH